MNRSFNKLPTSLYFMRDIEKLLINSKSSFIEIAKRRGEPSPPVNNRIVLGKRSDAQLRETLKKHEEYLKWSLSKASDKVVYGTA